MLFRPTNPISHRLARFAFIAACVSALVVAVSGPLHRFLGVDVDAVISLFRYGFYVAAGAKYFVSMGVHHDNFDLWNSRFHWWNAVNTGPHRDVVGEWQREAKKNGMHFGVSEHLGASFTWFQASHRSDKNGPFAGVPYDGANPIYDELYHPDAAAGDDDAVIG